MRQTIINVLVILMDAWQNIAIVSLIFAAIRSEHRARVAERRARWERVPR